MKHVKTLNTRDLKKSVKKGGCGECQTSCQSACKTSCSVANQHCEQKKEKQHTAGALLAEQRLFLWGYEPRRGLEESETNKPPAMRVRIEG